MLKQATHSLLYLKLVFFIIATIRSYCHITAKYLWIDRFVLLLVLFPYGLSTCGHYPRKMQTGQARFLLISQLLGITSFYIILTFWRLPAFGNPVTPPLPGNT